MPCSDTSYLSIPGTMRTHLPVETLRPLLAAGLLCAGLVGVVGLAVCGQQRRSGEAAAGETNRRLVRQLKLTDLALWSEATYCRHPTQADRFAAWSDHPGALEHFPAGSIVPPPQIGPTDEGRRRIVR
jgi:hypothetical protein